MQRIFECEVGGLFWAAARRRRAAKTSLFIQKVFDCKWYYRQALGTRPLSMALQAGALHVTSLHAEGRMHPESLQIPVDAHEGLTRG